MTRHHPLTIQVEVVPKPLLQKARSLVAQREKLISIGQTLAEAAEGEEAVGEAWEDLPMEHRMKFAAYVLRKESRWKEMKPSIITRYEQARVGEVPDRCEGRAAGQQTKAQLLEKVKEVCQSLHKVNAVKRAL